MDFSAATWVSKCSSMGGKICGIKLLMKVSQVRISVEVLHTPSPLERNLYRIILDTGVPQMRRFSVFTSFSFLSPGNKMPGSIRGGSSIHPAVSHANNTHEVLLRKYSSFPRSIGEAGGFPFWDCLLLGQEQIFFVAKFLILGWDQKALLENWERAGCVGGGGRSYKSPRFLGSHLLQPPQAVQNSSLQSTVQGLGHLLQTAVGLLSPLLGAWPLIA